MDRIPVRSSNICAIGYDAVASTLEIEFSSGSVYQYLDVPEDEFDGLMAAASKGRYLNQKIKDRYQYHQIR